MVEPGKGHVGHQVLRPFGRQGEPVARCVDEAGIEAVRPDLGAGEGGQILIAQVSREDGHVEEGRHGADDQVGRVDPAEDQRLDHAVVTPRSQSTASAAECA